LLLWGICSWGIFSRALPLCWSMGSSSRLKLVIYRQSSSDFQHSFVGYHGLHLAQGLLHGLAQRASRQSGVPAQACSLALQCSGTAHDLQIALLFGQDAQGLASGESEAGRAGRAIGEQLLALLDQPFTTPTDWPRSWPLPAELASGRSCLALLTFLSSQLYAGGHALVHQSSLAEPLCAVVTLDFDTDGDLSSMQASTMQSCVDPVAWHAITKRIEQADDEDENAAGADVPRH